MTTTWKCWISRSMEEQASTQLSFFFRIFFWGRGGKRVRPPFQLTLYSCNPIKCKPEKVSQHPLSFHLAWTSDNGSNVKISFWFTQCYTSSLYACACSFTFSFPEAALAFYSGQVLECNSRFSCWKNPRILDPGFNTSYIFISTE